MRTTEEWRPVEGYESLYSVSSFGRVRSRWKNGTLLQPVKRSNGYLHVQLCKGDGTKKQASIHTLVACAFLGPRPAGFDVSHVDGAKWNNAADNLRYESHSSNCLRRRSHGTEHIPSYAKVSADDVVRAKSLKAEGWLQREIAEEMGISQPAVSRLLAGKTWASVS